jgi:CHAT domain-containing protein/tetratricopeptide (TPR) repeat protein
MARALAFLVLFGLAPGGTFRGRLDAEPKGANARIVELRAEVDGPLVVRAHSLDFDTLLRVHTIEGSGGAVLLAEDDDGGDGSDSRVRLEAKAGARYRIEVRSTGDLGAGGDVEITTSSAEKRRDAAAEEKADLVYWDAVEARAKEAGAPEGRARALLGRAAVHTLRARYAEAAEVSRSAIEVLEKSLGPDDARVAAALTSLGIALRQAGSLDEARPHHERALALREKRLGPEDPKVAESLDQLAIVLLKSGTYPAAKAHAERALAIWEKRSGPDHPDTARAASTLGQILLATGARKEARAQFERALRISEKSLDPDDPRLVERLNNLAETVMMDGALGEAAALVRRSLDVAETSLGPDHPEVGGILHNLGMLSGVAGDDVEAVAYYRKALSNLEASLGPTHPDVAGCLRNLGTALDRLGQYTEAKLHLERSLAITEERVGKVHRDVAFVINSLAILNQHMGSYAAAKELFDRAVAISETLFGPEHPDLAAQMHNKALVLRDMGFLNEARLAEERAIQIREKVLGPEHALVASSLLGLGAILVDLGESEAARRALTRSLEIQGKQPKPDASTISSCHTQLARAAEGAGDLGEARSLYEKALALEQARVGPDHPVATRVESRLARVLLASGDVQESLRLSLRTERASREQLQVLTSSLPERQALDYAATRPMGLDHALSLLAHWSAPAGAAESVWDEVVRSRALVLDEVASRHRAVFESSDPEIVALRADLAAARGRLAQLFVRGPGRGIPEEFRASLDEARKKKEGAEESLARKSAAHGAELSRTRAGIAEVRSALPRGAALVAFSRYTSFPVGTKGAPAPKPVATPRSAYLALVLSGPEATPVAVPLGDAEEIEGLVARWREEAGQRVAPRGRLAARFERAYDLVASELRKKIWDPVRRLCPAAATVFVVPDGAIHLVSLAALPDGRSGFLIETGPLVHALTTERDLLSGLGDAKAGEGLLAMGGPSFDDAEAPVAVAGAFRGTRSACADLQSRRFAPLAAAAEEAGDVATLWKEVSPASEPLQLTRLAATEAVFKARAPGKRALHLATHGFFLDGACSTGGPGVPSSPQAEPRAVGENPLLLSGLVFAGANRREAASHEQEDGILTAEEIAALDLSTVEWAVLSACDTGIGRVRPGEGVFGLRRAFRIAGVSTLIMSLWPVDDEATRAWMRSLYDARLSRGLRTHEAVREAGRAVLRARRAAGETDHPSAWAAFVAAGDWR